MSPRCPYWLLLAILALPLQPAAGQVISNPPQPVFPLDPLDNGGFEAPNLAAGTFQYLPSGGSWAFTNGTGVAANGSQFGNPAAPQGDQVGIVQGNGSLTQNFALAPGRYRISFKAAQRIYQGVNSQELEIRIDGAVLAVVKPAGASFAAYSTQSFVIAAGQHQLKIAGLNPLGGDHTAFLDEVKIESLAAIAKSWSDPAAWQSGAPPTAGSDGTIPAGTVVRLDSTSAAVRNLVVLGELVCADQDLALSAESIMLHGRFECGSAFSPYLQNFVLTLTANPPQNGEKSFEVMAPGVLELHGAPKLAWTRLRSNAAAGATLLELADPVDWQQFDRIVLAPSTYLTDTLGKLIHRDEVAEIQAIQNGGLDLQLLAPLAFAHYGQSSSYNTASGNFVLDERSEVGLISRNIKIQGDPASDSSLKGGHLMSMVGSTVHVSGIELYRMGRIGELGRYPFHWHLVGDAPGQYIENSSIHRSFNRCVTVHGTNMTRVADNVCHDFVGHGYFLENGSERLNTFAGNLGIKGKKPGPGQSVDDPFLGDSDTRTGAASNGPAVFWISNAENTFTGNAAAGSEGTGFWYRIDQEIAPAFGVFKDNRAHSSTQGFSTCRNDGGPQGMTVPGGLALIENLTVYHTGQGVWPCSSEMNRETHLFRGLVVANTQNGMQAPNPMIFEDSAFIGYSPNTPAQVSPASDLNWRAIQVYDQGFVLERVAFVNYKYPAMSVFYPGAGAHKLAKNRTSGISLVDSPNVFPDPDDFSQPGAGPAMWGDVIHDLDGSLFGQDRALVNDHPLMYDADCLKPVAGPSGAPMRVAGYACPERYGHFRAEHAYDYLQPNILPFISPITVLREDGYRNSSQHIERRFITQFSHDEHRYTFRYDQGAKHNNIQLELRDVDPGSEAVFEILDVPPTVTLSGPGATWLPATDIDDLEAGPGHRYLWRDYSLHLKMAATGLPWHAMDEVKLCLTGTNCCPNFWACSIATDTLALGPLPMLEITAPADGARIPSGSGAVISAAPASGSAPVVAGYLYVGNQIVGADRTPPFSFNLPPLPDGAYTLKLRAAATGGKSFTTLQQIFVGEPGPRVEITSLPQLSTWDGAQPIPVAFQLHNWPLGGGNHLRLLDNDLELGFGKIGSTAPLALAGLAQGRHEIELALGLPNGEISANGDRKTIYAMHGGVLADFEDGVDQRTSLEGDANLQHVSAIGWAWGNPLALADGQDDINYFDVYNDGGLPGVATYRLKIEPAADWRSYQKVLVKMTGLQFDVAVVDAGGGATTLTPPAGNPFPSPMSFQLPANPTLIDQVVALELRFSEQNIPNLPLPFIPRVHLYRIRLMP
jgi:hypothetical protein